VLLPNPDQNLPFPEEAGLEYIPQVPEKSRHGKTCLNSLTLIGAHKVDSDYFGLDGAYHAIKALPTGGRLSPEDLGRSYA